MRKLGKQILSLGLLAAWGTGFSQVEMTEGQYQPYGVVVRRATALAGWPVSAMTAGRWALL